jgi:hypothetical protein
MKQIWIECKCGASTLRCECYEKLERQLADALEFKNAAETIINRCYVGNLSRSQAFNEMADLLKRPKGEE